MLFRVPYYLLRVRAVRELSRLCGRGRGLVLTYDDGPGRRLSRALVGLLGSRGARATFFVLGRRVVEDGETVDLVRVCCKDYAIRVGLDYIRETDWPKTMQIEQPEDGRLIAFSLDVSPEPTLYVTRDESNDADLWPSDAQDPTNTNRS